MNEYFWLITLSTPKRTGYTATSVNGITEWAHGETRTSIFTRLLEYALKETGFPKGQTVVLFFSLERNI